MMKVTQTPQVHAADLVAKVATHLIGLSVLDYKLPNPIFEVRN